MLHWKFMKIELVGKADYSKLEQILEDGWEPFGGGPWVSEESSGDTIYLRKEVI